MPDDGYGDGEYEDYLRRQFADEDTPPAGYQPPAGWIPPQFRQPILRELSDEEVAEISPTISVTEFDENDQPHTRSLTPEEIRARVKKDIGVIDTRDGKVHPNQAGTPICRVNINR